MNKLSVVFVATLLCIGCHRKNEDGTTATSLIPGQGATVVKTVSGSIDALTGCGSTCIQNVSVVYDKDNFPGDTIAVNLCRNAVCADSLPSAQCAQVTGLTPCYTSIPNRNIYVGNNTVGFINAFEASYSDGAHTIVLSPGYSSYSITTITSR